MNSAMNELIYKSLVSNAFHNQTSMMGANINQNESLLNHEENESSETSTTSSSNLQSGSLSDTSIAESENEEKNDEELDDVYVKEQDNDQVYVKEEHNESIDEEVDEDEEENVEIKPVIKQEQSQMYQKSCLAAAQMMQLMCSTSSMSTNQSNLIAQNQSNNTSPNGENEKENIPICKYCNKIFANFSNLNHHISAIHLNQSKWICSQCGKICSSKSNLKVHLRVHLRVKPYHCRWCSYSCMHHSSIRDHLAKVHPDKTHTPLQPGYLFNSQAVPEPEVFNSNGFNANSFVNESKAKRTSSEALTNDRSMSSPEKNRTNKKIRLNNDKQTLNKSQNNQANLVSSRSRSPVKQELNYSQIQTSNLGLLNQNQTLSNQNQSSMSNLYNAYTMARMFPFMYNPMQMQYAAANAIAHNNTQQSSTPTSQFLGMLNQNMLQQFTNGHQSRSAFNYSSLLQDNSNAFSSLSGSNSSSSSSDEHQTNSSGNYSYSGSSRSSSMSPSIKGEMKQMSTSTSTDDGIEKSKILSPSQEMKPTRKTLTVDQMLNNTVNNKVSKETQTEPSCLKCPYCKNSSL